MPKHYHLVLTPIASRIAPHFSAPLAMRLDAALQAALPTLLEQERLTVAEVADVLDKVAQAPDVEDLKLLDLLVRHLQKRLRRLGTLHHAGLRAIELADRAFASERPEIMDAAWAPEWLHAAEIRWLDKFNRDLGNYARWQDLLLEAVADVPDARIEDVAAGSAGFLLWVAKHSPRKDLHLTASDYSADYVALGQKAAAAQQDGQPLTVLQRDATQMAELAGQVDLIVSTQATHHMEPGLIARLLHQGLRAATHGVLVIDVLRSLGGLFAASVATNLSTPAPPLMLDAMQSVRRGFLPAELALLAHLAGARHVQATAKGPAYAVLRARL
jgi:SAM-dependent methyltransferase